MENYEINQKSKCKMQNDKSKFKIIFLGRGQFGEIIFKALADANYNPLAVDDFKKIKELKPDLVIVASFGKIIPKEILKVPKYGCLNVHGSLLPKYRGPSPIQTAILNGDRETGVTIILMDEKIDHGPIVANSNFQIPNSKITYEELSKELAKLGAKLLLKTIPKWVKGKIEAKLQDESKASYTKLLKREDGEIDWSKPAAAIERKIRAFYPWPGTFFFWKGKRIKILGAKLLKNNKLIIEKVQPEGKKPMTLDDFKLGHPDFTLPHIYPAKAKV